MKKAKYVFEGIAVVALVAVSTNSFVFAQEKNLWGQHLKEAGISIWVVGIFNMEGQRFHN